MHDSYGNLVTSARGLEKLTIEMYSKILSAFKIKDHLEVHQMRQENLCNKRLEGHLIKKTQKNGLWKILKMFLNSKKKLEVKRSYGFY